MVLLLHVTAVQMTRNTAKNATICAVTQWWDMTHFCLTCVISLPCTRRCFSRCSCSCFSFSSLSSLFCFISSWTLQHSERSTELLSTTRLLRGGSETYNRQTNVRTKVPKWEIKNLSNYLKKIIPFLANFLHTKWSYSHGNL